jgi:predicted PurR-regulated permease PerM
LAFIPFAGAIVAGALAVLVTLATSGTGGALIILVVAVLVQQFDNELLAPWIYGKALDMHPVAVLLAITAGGALFGLAGAFLAVPVTALVVNVVVEHRVARREAAGQVAGPAPPEPR